MAYLPLTLLTGSVSAGATLDIDFSAFAANYAIVELYIYNVVPATSGSNLLMRTSTDGTTFDSAAASYKWINFFASGSPSTGTNNSSSDTSIGIINALGNGTGASTNGRITIYNPGSAALFPLFTWHIAQTDTSGGVAIVEGTGQRLAAQATKGLRFLMSAGNVTANYRLTGIR